MNALKIIFILLLLQGSTLFGGIQYGIATTGGGGVISTSLAVWPDNSFYLEGWTVQVEVNIWDEYGQPVTTGEVRISDLDGNTDVNATVSEQSTVVSWVAVTAGLLGIHRFEITYSDPNQQYGASSIIIELLIDKEVISGETSALISLDSAVTNVAKGQAINVTGTLTSQDAVFPYFYIDPETAYLSIEAEINGSWKILSVNYPSTGITAEYRFKLPLALPPWIPTGLIPARCRFSGSVDSDLASYVKPFTINLLAQEKILVFLPKETSVERNNLTEQNILAVDVQVPGFDSDPVAVNVDLLAMDGSLVKNLLFNHLLADYSSQLFLEFPQDIAIGTYNLLASLIDWQTGVILSIANAPVTVTDDLLVDNFYWNVQDHLVMPGQYVQGYLVSREEDTFVAVKSELQIQLADTAEILFTNITSDSGYVTFTIEFPGDLQPGIYDVEFVLTPLPVDQYHQAVIKSVAVTVQRDTTITHQESLFLVRQGEGWFNATVVDESWVPVTAGTLSLSMNGKLLYGSTDPIASYQYNVPADAPRGINHFQWSYTNGDIYRDSQESFPLALYSVPSFFNLSSANVEIFSGSEYAITGQILEETGEKVVGAAINVIHRDNWGNITSFQILTDEEGTFTFNFTPDRENSGIHFFTVSFDGWPEEYYLAVQGKPVFEISVSPPLSLSITEKLIAGENATLEFRGKPDQEVILEIFVNTSWDELDTILLDSNGIHRYGWTIPDYLRGEILIRASYIGDQESALFNLKILVKPQLIVQVPDSPVMTGEEVVVVVSCSENHEIWLDGEQWLADISPGSRQYVLVFAEAGDHELEILVTGEDVVETIESTILQIRENYIITIDMPVRVQKGTEVNVEINTVDTNQQPLEGFTVELFLNDSLITTSMTSQAGKSIMNLSLETGIYGLVFKVIPGNPLVYISKEILYGDLTVYSIPTIEIQDLKPVKGKLVTIRTRMTDGQVPVIGETIHFRLKSISGNIDDFIGSNETDNRGYTEITWDVTRDSGNYLLQIEYQGSKLLEPVLVARAIQVLEKGPEFIQADVIVQNNEQNLYLVTAVVLFPGGTGSVYLCTSSTGDLLGELYENGDFWTLTFQLGKGTHELWLKAVDAAGVENWYDLGVVNVMNDLSGAPNTEEPVKSGTLTETVRDTLLSTILLLPVAGIIAYRKRKSQVKG